MLFHAATADTPALAISQPSHAWISGRLLRAWARPLPEPLLLAAEQHDIAWTDWERVPTFDATTGRPHLFRAIGAAEHAPMWALGVDRALQCWGRHVALLISRHGGLIYTRFTDRHRVGDADTDAADYYLRTQGEKQAVWMRTLGLDADTIEHDQAMLALSDQLSLVLCGELAIPHEAEVPDGRGNLTPIALRGVPGKSREYTLTPWPFAVPELVLEVEARPLPAEGRFADEAAMRAWYEKPERVIHRVRLTQG
ncbi:DUF3891 family protein [Acetobacteraceae bacterium H6797]|nr:DUF3891 family protein [Acetobacteraceae bacterium H6797]